MVVVDQELFAGRGDGDLKPIESKLLSHVHQSICMLTGSPAPPDGPDLLFVHPAS